MYTCVPDLFQEYKFNYFFRYLFFKNASNDMTDLELPFNILKAVLKKQAYKILMLSKIAINKRIHFN
jgi:hypothetical protein